MIQSNFCNVKHQSRLNPVDYKVCGVMQQRVYEMQIHNVDEHKQRLVDVWSSLQQSVVDAAVSDWRKRL